MSPPPHREKNAKVEGRDPPEPAKETMGLFRMLTVRLLRVPMSEVKEQQRLYNEARTKRPNVPINEKPKLKNVSLPTMPDSANKSSGDIPNPKK